MKFDPSDFGGTLNPDVYLEWTQTVERLFEVKGYFDKKSFQISILKLKKYASFGMKTPKGNELGNESHGLTLGPN